jgi:beta-galactosidase
MHAMRLNQKLSRTLALIVLGWFAIGAHAVGRGYDTFLFGVAYYPEQWSESDWEPDAQRMRECGVNAVRMGEFGWAVMEPSEGHYDFALFDRAIATMARHGIKTIFGTPTAAPPKWLTQKYPEVLHVFESGRPANDQSRRYYCYNSAVYRRFSRGIVEALARHYRDNPNIVGWQIDNEFNNENRECFSDSCRVAFRQWLREKYATLDALNTRWGTRFWSQWYSEWDQIDLPFRTPAFHNPALMLDFKRFISASVASYAGEQIGILRRERPGDFLTTNGAFKNIDYHAFSRALDLHAQSNYPTFIDVPRFPTGAALTLVRGFNGRMMIIEQLTGPAGQTYLLRTPRPGEARLWAMQAIAHGADGVLHFRWRAARRGAEEYWYGVLDHDNVPRPRFEEFKKEGRELQTIGPAVLGSTVDSEIAAIKDFESEWVFDHQFLTPEVDVGASFTALFQAASELRYNIDFVGPEADLARYKIVFAPQSVLTDDAFAARLRRFVQEGGTLIMSAHSAIKDRDNAMIGTALPAGFTDLFGIDVDSYQTYQPPSRDQNAVQFDAGAGVPVRVFAEALHATTAQVVGRWQRDYLKGMTAATERQAGKGKAVYYGSLFNVESARYLIQRYARDQHVEPLLTGVPAEVEVTRRVKGPREYYFLLNHAETGAALSPGSGFVDVATGNSAPPTFTLGAFDYQVLARERTSRSKASR